MRAFAALAGLGALALLPFVLSPYHMTLLLPMLGYGIALLGLNLLFGQAGLVSFGHAMFVAAGAYAAAAMGSRLGVRSLEFSLLAAIGASLVLAIPIGLLCVRYTKIFFGMLTLAFGMLFHSFLFKFYDITGGDQGMRLPRPTILGNAFPDLSKTEYLIGPFYWAALLLFALAAFVMWRIVQSPLGLALRAQRENARKAEYLGIEVHRARFVAFVISAAYGAVGGVLLAVPTGLADPELAYWTHSGVLVFMTLLGGFGHFLGPVVGAAAYVLLQDTLMSHTPYWRLAMGALLAVMVVAFPGGLMGIAAMLRGRRAEAARRAEQAA